MPIFLFHDIWSLKMTVAGKIARTMSLKAEYAVEASQINYYQQHRDNTYHQQKKRSSRELLDSSTYVGY